MRNMIFCLFAMLSHDLLLGTTSDFVVKSTIERSARFDHPWDSSSEMRYAMRLCEYDTNRFVRVLQELATEKPEMCVLAVSLLRQFGNSSALPFLYQNVTNLTNLKIGMYAAEAILEIEGITSNSIAHVDRFLKMPQNNKLPGREVCANMIMYAKRPNVAPALKALALSSAVDYASRNNFYPDYIDGLIISADSTYRMSKRRLATLRAVSTLEVHEDCTNYVVTAINELVAYPEANLPE